MSDKQNISPEVPKITIGARTSDEEVRRSRELVDGEYDKIVGEIISMIPEHLSAADKLATLYAVFLDKMTYDFDTGNNVDDDGTVSIAGSSDEKYARVIEDKDLRLAGKDAAIINGIGVCENFRGRLCGYI